MDISEKLATYLAKSSKSVSESRNYLKKKGFNEKDIEEIIEEFKDIGYLDDKNYSYEFFLYAKKKRWADRRIFLELYKRGISDEDAQDGYFEFLDLEADKFPSDAECCKIIAEGMIANGRHFFCGEEIEKLKNRIGRRLSYYGYSTDLIIDTIEYVDAKLHEEEE